jgi:hypothetical protein
MTIRRYVHVQFWTTGQNLKNEAVSEAKTFFCCYKMFFNSFWTEGGTNNSSWPLGANEGLTFTRVHCMCNALFM